MENKEKEINDEEYINTLKESFNVEAINANFGYLEKLGSIDETISKLEETFRDQSEISEKIEAIKKAVEEIKEKKPVNTEFRSNMGYTPQNIKPSTTFVPATPRPVTVPYTSPKTNTDNSTNPNIVFEQKEEKSKKGFFGRIFGSKK